LWRRRAHILPVQNVAIAGEDVPDRGAVLISRPLVRR
jgi:hypothetical protein